MAIYYSLGVDGVPFGARFPSDAAARKGAQDAMHEFNDIARLEVLKVTTQSHGFEYRTKPVTHEVKPVPVTHSVDLFADAAPAKLPDLI
jgi:hypothetical protein